MLNHSVPVIVVSRRLGYAKPSITLDVYGHLIPSMQIEAAQKIDELITTVELHQIAPKLQLALGRKSDSHHLTECGHHIKHKT